MDKTKSLRIYFSISCHEAVSDAIISSYLVKKNFKSFNIFTKLTITKKSTLNQRINYKNYFDEISEAFIPKIDLRLKKYFHQNIGSIRLFNSIIQSGKKAKEKNFDFIIYLNSGSWIIDSKKILKVLKLMSSKQYLFGSRVQTFLNGKAIYFDDHFLIVNLKAKSLQNPFNIPYNSRAYLPIDFYYGGIHKNLFSWYSMFPKNSLYIYSDLGNSYDEYGNIGARFIPLSWDSNNFLLHSNSRYGNVFPLRKKYLTLIKFDIDDDNIKDIIESWSDTWKYKIKKCLVKNNTIFFYELQLLSKFKRNIREIIFKRYKDYYPVSKIDERKIN